MGSQYRENYKRQVGRNVPAQDSPDTVAVRDILAVFPLQVNATSSGLVFTTAASSSGVQSIGATTDGALARWHGALGAFIQNGNVILSDTGDMTGANEIDARTLRVTVGVEGGSISGVWTGNVITETFGGTNQSSYTTGDILYASASSTLSKLGAGIEGHVLTMSGGAPIWTIASGIGTVTLVGDASGPDSATIVSGLQGVHVSDATPTVGQLFQFDGAQWIATTNDFTTQADIFASGFLTPTVSALDGGTAQTGYLTGDILYSPAQDTLNRLVIGSTDQVLTVISGVPSWEDAQAGLTDLTASGFVVGPASATDSALALYDGATGKLIKDSQIFSSDGVTLQATGLIIENQITTSGIVVTATSELGTVTSGIWTATEISALYGGTAQTGYLAGDILYSPAQDTLDRLAAGTEGYVLTVNAGLPSWQAPSGGAGGVPDLTASGFVVGPASATNNAVALYDGITGELIKDSSIFSSDGETLQATGLIVDQLTTTSGLVVTDYAQFPPFDSLNVNPTGVSTLGVVISGVWTATEIASLYGGTAQTGYLTGDILYSPAQDTLSRLAVGDTGQVLTVISGTPSWQDSTIKKITEASGSATYTIQNLDYMVRVDTVGQAVTVTMPPTPDRGQVHIIKDGNGNAAANNITVTANTGQLIDPSASTLVMNAAFQSVQLIWVDDPGVWHII